MRWASAALGIANIGEGQNPPYAQAFLYLEDNEPNQLNILLDSGAQANFLKGNVAKELLDFYPSYTKVKDIDGHTMKCYGSSQVTLRIQDGTGNDRVNQIHFHFVDMDGIEAILGYP